MIDSPPPRRRRRSQRPAGPAVPEPDLAGVADPPVEVGRVEPAANRSAPNSQRGRTKGRNQSEDRGWRDLAGNSPSQLGVSGALRARDVARPSEADLAAAERELTIVHRQWQPPADSAG